MPRVSVDFSDVQEFEPLEKGEYSGEITDLTYVEPATDDKYPYLNVEVTLNEDGFENRKAWIIWSLSPKALFRMKQDFDNLGLDTEEEIEVDYDEDTMQVTEPDIIGLDVVVLADKPRLYEGRKQNNIVALLSPDGAPAAASDESDGEDEEKPKAKKKAPANKKTTRKFK